MVLPSWLMSKKRPPRLGRRDVKTAQSARRWQPRFEALEDRTLPVITSAFSGSLALSVGSNVNISRLTGNQEEAAIIQNPVRSNQLFAFSNAEAAGMFAAHSTDAGTTWLPVNSADFIIADGN